MNIKVIKIKLTQFLFEIFLIFLSTFEHTSFSWISSLNSLAFLLWEEFYSFKRLSSSSLTS